MGALCAKKKKDPSTTTSGADAKAGSDGKGVNPRFSKKISLKRPDSGIARRISFVQHPQRDDTNSAASDVTPSVELSSVLSTHRSTPPSIPRSTSSEQSRPKIQKSLPLPAPTKTRFKLTKHPTFVGLPVNRRRLKRRPQWRQEVVSMSVNDRAVHYSSSVIIRLVEFANRSGCAGKAGQSGCDRDTENNDCC